MAARTSEHEDRQYAAFNSQIDAEHVLSLRKSMKRQSTWELCTLAAHLNINYCAEFFKKASVDGEEMVLFSQEEFVSMLKTNTGVNNAKALKAWNRLQPLLPSKLATATKHTIRALVVGNNKYNPDSGLTTLKNAVPDSRAIRKMLRDKGAEVFYGENLTIEEFRALEEQYLDALQKGDIGIIYFAGHAYMYNSATQLMTVTNVEPNMKDHAVNVRKLNIRMKKRGTKANIFILDCCRNMKYSENRGGSSPATNTQKTQMRTDTVYAYATAPGHPASDGHNGHGLYTASILRHFTKPMALRKVFDLISKEVREKSGGRQQPHVESSLCEDLFLFGQSPSEVDYPDISTDSHHAPHERPNSTESTTPSSEPKGDNKAAPSTDDFFTTLTPAPSSADDFFASMSTPVPAARQTPVVTDDFFTQTKTYTGSSGSTFRFGDANCGGGITNSGSTTAAFSFGNDPPASASSGFGGGDATSSGGGFGSGGFDAGEDTFAFGQNGGAGNSGTGTGFGGAYGNTHEIAGVVSTHNALM